jgi:hypothetical protein
VSFSSRLQWMTDRELIKHARTKWLYKPRMYTAMVGGWLSSSLAQLQSY